MQFRPRIGKGNPARRCTPRRNPNRGCGGQLRRNRITDARRSIAFDPPRVPRACGRVFLETRWVSTSPVRAVPVSPHVVRPLVEAHDIRRDLQGTRVARQPHWFERRIECWPPVPRPLWRSKRPESKHRSELAAYCDHDRLSVEVGMTSSNRSLTSPIRGQHRPQG
jgi:hypothetical protein